MEDNFNDYLPQDTVLGKLKMVNVADFYDRPVLFICENEEGKQYLVVLVDQVWNGECWLYTEFSDLDTVDLHDQFYCSATVYYIVTYFGRMPSMGYIMAGIDLREDQLPMKGEFYARNS